jgi:hypothetical protein
MSQRTDAEKARRINAEVRLLSRLNRCGEDQLNCPCPLCAGEVAMRVISRDARGHVEKSSGACATPNCLEWNQ